MLKVSQLGLLVMVVACHPRAVERPVEPVAVVAAEDETVAESALLWREAVDSRTNDYVRRWMRHFPAIRATCIEEWIQPLAAAARCRSESDWIDGINSPRALTAPTSRHGGLRLTPAGRKQLDAELSAPDRVGGAIRSRLKTA